jgi:hypothetical protein
MPATESNVFLLFTQRLEELGIRYIVTGSVASIAYGEARLTHDVDLVVDLMAADVDKLAMAFPTSLFYLPPVEVLQVEARRTQRGHFNIIHHDTGFKADVYPCGRDRLSLWGMDNARRIEIEGQHVSFAPPEYVILRKLEYFREGGSEKHLRDIEGILATSGDLLEEAEIDRWVDSLGVRSQWEALRPQKGPTSP